MRFRYTTLARVVAEYKQARGSAAPGAPDGGGEWEIRFPPRRASLGAWLHVIARAAWWEHRTIATLVPARTDRLWWQAWVESHPNDMVERRFLPSALVTAGDSHDLPVGWRHPVVLLIYHPCVHHWLITDPRMIPAPDGYKVKQIAVLHFERTHRRCLRCEKEIEMDCPIFEWEFGRGEE